MDVHAAQWIGKRQQQEDAYAIKHLPTGTLAIVCDGMGGHSLGAAAAQTAAEAFKKSFDIAQGLSLPEVLNASLSYANSCVHRLFAQGAEDEIGGCTLLACFVTNSSLLWFCVGYSPLFVWRRGMLHRLNADHSLRSIYDDIKIAPSYSERSRHSQRNMLRSAVMGDEISLIDAPKAPYPLLPGDRVIISSDGTEDVLFHTFLTPRIVNLLNSREIPLASCIVNTCKQLNEPYADNATVLTLDL